MNVYDIISIIVFEENNFCPGIIAQAKMCTCYSLKQERRGVTMNVLQLGFFDQLANGKLQQSQSHYFYTVAFFQLQNIFLHGV